MNLDQSERWFQCPYCGSQISVLVDLSVDEQNFIEDCEVCCRPIAFHVYVEDGRLAHFDIDRS